ncbi:site-specific tyrosine recombinase XerD [Hahella ganghwensis]|uniref:site-specific tyrosine recombinase XerD n=1 Tax=Hahella ganghwensis TaxID=286420 RepID=UPI000381D584|nr:site-specific tyrosine recombinase XerD [Hahella ganghwensis]
MDDQLLINKFIDSLWLEAGLSKNTQSAYRSDLQKLSLWLLQQNSCLHKARREELLTYLAAKMKKGAKSTSSARTLTTMRRFYRYLLREQLVPEDPTLKIEHPRVQRSLPSSLTESEVDSLLDEPDKDLEIEHRDAVMLEVLYASGLRVSELVGLHLEQLNLQQGVVRVMGKGGKERLVPLGDAALDALKDYLSAVRPLLVVGGGQSVVFPSLRGREMTRQTFWHRIKLYAQRSGIRKNITPHTLRHAFATHLVNHGADLRVVQLLLGHSDLSTTQIYTHVAKARMQRLHSQHHPRG